MDPISPTGPITAELALRAIEAARGRAHELGVLVSVALVDAGGNLKAFLRMDGAEIAGPALAVDKAYTAVATRCATHELADFAQHGQALYGLHNAAGGRLVVLGGGIPLVVDGEVVGAVGVSGANEVDHDVACAEAAAAALA